MACRQLAGLQVIAGPAAVTVKQIDCTQTTCQTRETNYKLQQEFAHFETRKQPSEEANHIMDRTVLVVLYSRAQY